MGIKKPRLALIGVSCCGRPVSRVLDDGRTLEINRLCCLSGSRDACSMLYSRSCAVAEALGYRKVTTYILESETGSSLRASGFILGEGFQMQLYQVIVVHLRSTILSLPCLEKSTDLLNVAAVGGKTACFVLTKKAIHA